MGVLQDVGIMNYIVLQALAGALAGALGAMGLGGGSILIIYLTMFAGFQQAQAQGVNLIFFLPIAFLAVVIYSKKQLIVWKIAIPAILFGMIGALIGAKLSIFLQTKILKKIFGFFLLIIGLNQLFSKNKK